MSQLVSRSCHVDMQGKLAVEASDMADIVESNGLPVIEETSSEEVEHVYANVREMEEESKRREQPSAPDVTEKPNRDMGGGWHEYLTETGRPYFFNTETGECHWKPPRFLKQPSEVNALINGSKGHAKALSRCDSEFADESLASCSTALSALSVTNDMAESIISNSIRPSSKERISMQGLASNSDLSAEQMHVYIKSGVHEWEKVPISTAAWEPCAPCSHDFLKRLHSNFNQKSIKCGTVEKCKIADAGIRLKKKEWSSCYLFLSPAHIIFYKDEKSAEKSGSHYETPLGMCDLRGATIQWLAEKDKRRKHIFQLELSDRTIYHFSAVNTQDVNGWFHALRQSQHGTCRTPVLERSGAAGSLIRNVSNVSQSSAARDGAHIRRSVKKMKSLSKGAASSTTEDAKKPQGVIEEARPTRESIIEKLKRFFRSRPSIESLKEKGIYKTEPVFGSTLAAICQHEQTTVPRFIQLVTEVIESKGLDADGLYRVSGNLSAIQRIRCQVDQEKYVALLGEDDVHVLTGALKLFFRELSEPIFPVTMAKDFINANRLPNGEHKFKAFDDLLKKLPLVNRETLKVLFGHLIRVASHADRNRMEIHNLAIMFGPSLFSSANEMSGDGRKLGASKKGKAVDKKAKDKPNAVQSNSHLAFNMIMQGQTVEYLLKEYRRFPSLHPVAYRN